MKKLVHPLVALMILALGAFIASPAQAKVYMPATGATFNDPTGRYGGSPTALMDQIITAVDNVPSGSIIRVVAYSFDYDPMKLALLRAKTRGVQVRLLIDSHTETQQIKDLRKALGTGTSDGSYLRTCKYSCMGRGVRSNGILCPRRDDLVHRCCLHCLLLCLATRWAGLGLTMQSTRSVA